MLTICVATGILVHIPRWLVKPIKTSELHYTMMTFLMIFIKITLQHPRNVQLAQVKMWYSLFLHSP